MSERVADGGRKYLRYPNGLPELYVPGPSAMYPRAMENKMCVCVELSDWGAMIHVASDGSGWWVAIMVLVVVVVVVVVLVVNPFLFSSILLGPRGWAGLGWAAIER